MEKLNQKEPLSTEIKNEYVDATTFDTTNLELKKKPKDREKFEELSQDIDVKNGAMKIFEKCCNDAMKEDFEKMENVNVKETMDDLMLGHKDLVIYITGNLNLPLSVEKFADLTTAQKLNFLALYETLNIGKDRSILGRLRDGQYSKGKESKDIANNCNQRLELYYKKINDSFKKTNYSNLGVIKETLENDFGLTENEAEKYKEYILLIKKHPEYIRTLKVQEAGAMGWFIAGVVVGALLALLGVYFVNTFGKGDGKTEIKKSKITIEDPYNVLKLITQEAPFEGEDSAEKPLFEVDGDDNLFEEFTKRAINTVEHKKVEMEVKGTLALEYDAGTYLNMEIDKNTGIMYLKICPPKVIVKDAQPYITNKRNERVHLSHFDQVEFDLFESIKQDAIEEAYKKPDFLDTAREQTYDMLLPLIQSLHPYGVDITGLDITYVDENGEPITKWPMDTPAPINVNIR